MMKNAIYFHPSSRITNALLLIGMLVTFTIDKLIKIIRLQINMRCAYIYIYNLHKGQIAMLKAKFIRIKFLHKKELHAENSLANLI